MNIVEANSEDLVRSESVGLNKSLLARLKLDDEKLRALGWDNQKNFDDELPTLIQYYKQNFKREESRSSHYRKRSKWIFLTYMDMPSCCLNIGE